MWAAPYLRGYDYTVDSSLEFLDKLLEKGPLPNESYTVLDYDTLYPSLEQAPANIMLYRFILQHLPEAETHICLIRDICHMITYNSYYAFQGRYYIQRKGVPIGGPIAGPMAELVVRFKEALVLNAFRPHLKLYVQ